MPIRNQYIALRREGWTYQAIADKYGVHRETVRRAVTYKRYSLPRRGSKFKKASHVHNQLEQHS